MMKRSSWAEVSSEAISNNIKVIREQVGAGVRVCAVVKADAYGHGLSGFVSTLSQHSFTDIVAVGKFSELIGIFSETPADMDILLLGAAEAEETAYALDKGEIEPVRSIFSVYNMDMLKRLDEVAAAAAVTLRVHIRIDIWDSGMGLSPEDFIKYRDKIMNMPHLEVCGLYVHMYTAYSDDLEEIESELKRFDEMVKKIEPEYRKRLCIHALNSSLIFSFPQYAYDMVRAGSALYGLSCGDGGRLKPLMRVCARIFDVREVDSGIPLSYLGGPGNGSARRRIARIMLGYWDMPLLLTCRDVKIWIKGRLYELADDICMDNLCIDISGSENIQVGDLAVVMGEEGVGAMEILDRNGIDHVHGEWMCMTADRLEKVYI